MKKIDLTCDCPKCTNICKPSERIKQDPGYFESEPARLFEGSPLWNDGANVPPGVREEEL